MSFGPNAPPIAMEELLSNPRGVAFAAFGSPAQLVAIGIAPADVQSFQASAHCHFTRMMSEPRRRRVAEVARSRGEPE